LTNVLQLFMPLDVGLLNGGREDFSQRAHGWQLSATCLPVELEVGKDVLEDAELAVTRFREERVRVQALEQLAKLRVTLGAFNVAALPSLSAHESDDGSAMLEWRLRDRRFAMALETESEESSWHLVFSQASGGTFAVGKIKQLDLRHVLALAFDQDPR
jgi:hypothetical protein